MAEGTHHILGAPGVLLATLGPGVANAANVIVNALQDQVPLIFITGRVDEAEAATYTHQVFDHTLLLSSITKATITLSDRSVGVQMDKALTIAMEYPPGPVHIDIPISLAAKNQTANSVSHRVLQPVAPATGPAFRAAKSCFQVAKKPLIIAGIGVLHDDASKSVAWIHLAGFLKKRVGQIVWS